MFEQTLTLAEQLISIPSITGNEAPALELMERTLQSFGWDTERWPVEENRFNLFAYAGKPKFIYSTHLDVVPAPESLFIPKRSTDALFGRGACDAKGIAAAMAIAATELMRRGAPDVGLLFLVDEERTSLGAKAAAPLLKEREIRMIVNGEPTDCYLVTGHKGAYIADVQFSGRSCHSGYPELGIDANAALIQVSNDLLQTDFGTSDLFGQATVNLGVLRGGVALNVVSPSAELTAMVRVVNSCAEVRTKLEQVVGQRGKILHRAASEPVRMKTVPGFKTKAVSYGTDIPHLLPSGAECLLYGPGSINVAHTDEEHLSFQELSESLEGYQRLYDALRSDL